jgi:molybdopterin synthase catalytic subunit
VSDAFVALRETPVSIDEIVAHVRHAGAGGICIFVGTVRDATHGALVLKLEYETYAAMALAEMRRIADEVATAVGGVRLALVHRSGVLDVGEIAVACAASAPHRDEAFRACRRLIDLTKQRVPIWKREHKIDGAHWVDWADAASGAAVVNEANPRPV